MYCAAARAALSTRMECSIAAPRSTAPPSKEISTGAIRANSTMDAPLRSRWPHRNTESRASINSLFHQPNELGLRRQVGQPEQPTAIGRVEAGVPGQGDRVRDKDRALAGRGVAAVLDVRIREVHHPGERQVRAAVDLDRRPPAAV